MKTLSLRRLAAVVTGGLLAAGAMTSCTDLTTATTTATTVSDTTTTVPPPLATSSAQVTAIRTGTTDAELVLTTTPLPPPDGPVDCRAVLDPPTTKETFFTVEVSVSMSYDSDPTELGACPGAAPREVIVLLAAPLGVRGVATDQPKAIWASDRGTTLQLCLRPACDPGPAEPPATVTCNDGTLDDVEPSADDTTRRPAVLADRCQGVFGIVDIDFGILSCAAANADPCRNQRTARLFKQAVGAEWRIIHQFPDGGCGGIEAVRPDFPTALCRDLPPLEGGTVWGS